MTRLLAVVKLPVAIQAAIAESRLRDQRRCVLARVADPSEQAALTRKLAAGEIGRDGLVGQRRRRAAEPTVNATLGSRVTLRLSCRRIITLVGPLADLEALVATLEELLGRARKARTQGLTLATLAKILADESRKTA